MLEQCSQRGGAKAAEGRKGGLALCVPPPPLRLCVEPCRQPGDALVLVASPRRTLNFVVAYGHDHYSVVAAFNLQT